MTQDDPVTVTLPRSLYERIERRVKASNEFDSVSDYVTYVLEQVLTEVEREKEVYSEEDRRKVEQRLRGLGYID